MTVYLVTFWETKLLHLLLKILKHSSSFVVCAIFQLHYGSAVAIDASMDDKSPWD